MTDEFVILVDEEDRTLGTMEKMEAHRQGVLHRAISILLFNDRGEMLLQKRADSKYHSGGLWTNTCCSHPRPNETVANAAARRLMEEMGISVSLKQVGTFTYRANLDKGLIEHELDHVFTGTFSDTPIINKQEVGDWKFINKHDLLADIQKNKNHYTEWFKIIIEKASVLSIWPQQAY